MSIPHLDLMREIQRYIDERIEKYTARYTIDGKINLNSGNVTGVLPRPNGGTGTGFGVGGHIVQGSGVALYQRPALNFVGSGVIALDNPGTSATDITINGVSFVIQRNGTPLTPRSILNFLGNGVSVVDNSGAGSTEVTIQNSGHVIQKAASSYAARPKLNFIGSAITVADNSTNDSTDVTITIGSAPTHHASHETSGGGDYLNPAAYQIPSSSCHDAGTLSELLNDAYCRINLLESSIGNFVVTDEGEILIDTETGQAMVEGTI